jgi:hypothetical protein
MSVVVDVLLRLRNLLEARTRDATFQFANFWRLEHQQIRARTAASPERLSPPLPVLCFTPSKISKIPPLDAEATSLVTPVGGARSRYGLPNSSSPSTRHLASNASSPAFVASACLQYLTARSTSKQLHPSSALRFLCACAYAYRIQTI